MILFFNAKKFFYVATFFGFKQRFCSFYTFFITFCLFLNFIELFNSLFDFLHFFTFFILKNAFLTLKITLLTLIKAQNPKHYLSILLYQNTLISFFFCCPAKNMFNTVL